MASSIHFHCIFLVVFFFNLASQLASTRLLNEESMLVRHKQWMAYHGRVYKDAEEKDTRFMIFKNNVEYIDAFNKGMDRGYKLSVNQFADLTNDEFRASRTGYNMRSQSNKAMSAASKPTSFTYAKVIAAPSTMDWRTKGAVMHPCKGPRPRRMLLGILCSGSSGRDPQTQNRQPNFAIRARARSCDVGGIDRGCEGGLMDSAFQFIKQNKGLTTEVNYPYEGQDGTCNIRKSANSAAKITGYEDVPSNNEKALLQAVANQPVSVAIEGGGLDFQFYSSGVFAGDCGTELDHAVTAIGYGTTAGGTKYWLVKNSWGSGWGENGFTRIQRDIAATEGLCGIAMKASYPLM